MIKDEGKTTMIVEMARGLGRKHSAQRQGQGHQTNIGPAKDK